MKTYKYIVVNKNKEKIKHFDKMKGVVEYVLGRNDRLVVVNESLVVQIDEKWCAETIKSVLHSMNLEN